MSKKKKKIFDDKEVHWMVWHGCLGKEEWKMPECVARTEKVNRKDQGNRTNASEYLDDPEVLEEKMKVVADLIKKSKCCVAYTGAGISRASGIADYGTKAENSVMNEYKKVKNPINALPTYSHHVLANLEKEGLLHYYVQQNHDGLPQKAGFPQEKMNEIHGAWFDPSNPVVQFSGNLRSDLFQAMVEIEEQIDLCLCLGTSLSGMNADRCVTTPCEKFAGGVENCNGSVIVNLQFTPVDQPGYIPIRVWAKIDDAMRILMKHLDMEMKIRKVSKIESDRITCPYNKDGMFDESQKMVLDLSVGSKVRICQPGAVNFGQEGTVIRKTENSHYTISFGIPWSGTSKKKKKKKKKKSDGSDISRYIARAFGMWWKDTIQKGAVMQIPIVNLEPEFVKEEEEDEEED